MRLPFFLVIFLVTFERLRAIMEYSDGKDDSLLRVSSKSFNMKFVGSGPASRCK